MQKEITIAFPSLFGVLASPWDEEYEIAKSAGFGVCKFDEETKKIKKDLTGQLVVYRGWFVSEDEYCDFAKSVRFKGGEVYTILSNYSVANSFQSWYKVLEKHTIPTHFVREDNFTELDSYFSNGSRYFVKDDLKSLGAGEQSFANSAQEAVDIYKKIKANRDFSIKNNGICLRKPVQIESEERFFVLDGHILGKPEKISNERESLVREIAYKMDKAFNVSFISVDVAKVDSVDTLVEIGDFQVSDMNKDGQDLSSVVRVYEDLRTRIVS